MCFVVLRHPSNLMLNRLSGKILHIDFGDCFEVCTAPRVLFLQVLFKWPAKFVPISKPELCFFMCKGCDDKREVPREDSFQTHKNVDQCNGGMD